MRTLATVLALVLQAFNVAVTADTREEATALLIAANNASDMRAGAKYRERAHFTIFDVKGGDASGDFERDYASPKEWREAFRVVGPKGGFEEILLRSEDQIWTLKNIDFEPLRVQQLRPSLRPTYLILTESDVLKGIDHDKINGVDARCIKIDTVTPGRKEQAHVCIDPRQSTYLSWDHPPDDLQYQFLEYVPFAGKLLPKRFLLLQRGKKLAEGSITWDLVGTFAPGFFAVPHSATSRRACIRAEHPIVVHRVEPVYPPGSGIRRLNGPVTVGIEISPEGRIIKAAVLETLDPFFDNAALDAVKSWTFEPAKCDGNAVVSDINVQVNFRTR